MQTPKLLKESSTKKGKINGIEEFERVIDPNFNNHGNFALLELSAERAKKFKIGTRKVITPLKLISEEERLVNLTRKAGFLLLPLKIVFLFSQKISIWLRKR